MHTSSCSTAIIILNYKNWKDTLACAESALASATPPRWVFIVDNASPDDSLGKLEDWAKGHIEEQLFALGVKQPCIKPLPYTLLTSDQESPLPPKTQLIIISSTENNGYAAGNNHGIRRAIQWGADAVWVVNNDTILEKEALGAMQERLFSAKRPGLCGSVVRYVDTGLVQCLGGGKTNPWTGLSRLFGHKEPIEKALQYSEQHVEQEINFIYGASVMASRNFVQTVGLMDERYFLYCEEQDWAYAAKGRFDIVYASKAVVHHKEGSTTGFSSKKMSLQSLKFLTRSRILLTAKFKPWALPTVFLSIAFAASRMTWRRAQAFVEKALHG